MSRVLVVLVAVLACVQQALAHRGCLDADCARIANTADGACVGSNELGVGYCDCASGYFWSGKDVKCLKAPANTVTISTGVADVSARVFKGWMIVKDKKFWTPAREFCKSQFGSDSDLASLPREADNQRLANKLTDALGNDKDGVWVGLATDKVSNNKADWSWLDTKKTPAYSVWDTGYPNMISLGQACGILLPDNANPNPARWQNGVCVGWARAFVCEIKY